MRTHYLVMCRQSVLVLLWMMLSPMLLSLLYTTVIACCHHRLLNMRLGSIVRWKERRLSVVEWVRRPTTFAFLQLLEILPQS